MSSAGFTSVFGNVTGGMAGGAVGDLFGAIGDFAESAGYSQAAGYAEQNAQNQKMIGEVQAQAETRQANQIIGTGETNAAGNGLTEGGSALYILRNSQQQKGLQVGMTNLQTQINVNQDMAQAAADNAMASSTQTAGIGGLVGGALSLLGI